MTTCKQIWKILLIYFAIYICSTENLIAQSDSLKVNLFEMNYEDLMKAEISAPGIQNMGITEIPINMEIITEKEIENSGYKSLKEILENALGLSNIADWAMFGCNFGFSSFWTKLNNKNTIFLMKGAKQISDNATKKEILDAINIPVESIDRIEVIKGPLLFINKNGAFYGVINIMTKKLVKNNGKKESQVHTELMIIIISPGSL